MLYIDAGVVTLALAALQGFLGGELVYGDGVFVNVRDPVEPAAGDSNTAASHDAHH